MPSTICQSRSKSNIRTMINGIINVYKEEGYTSFDVVAKLRRITGIKKIGHTGTLDPDAVGVLPVCIGSATKLCELLTDKTKEYVAGIKLGIETDTQDITGNILAQKEVNITREEFEKTILGFKGRSKQIPPMYSALKVGGRKLCDMARAGIEVERKPRDIQINDIEILNLDNDSASFRVDCSKGTYIRTLCHDIGKKLGCGAVMTDLKRTRSGDFIIDNAYKLSQIEEMAKESKLEEIITPVDSLFERYEALYVAGEDMKRVINGNIITPDIKAEYLRVYLDDKTFAALYRYSDERKGFVPFKMFFSGTDKT